LRRRVSGRRRSPAECPLISERTSYGAPLGGHRRGNLENTRLRTRSAGGDARRHVERPGDGRPGAISLEMLIVRIQLPTTAERRGTRQRAEGDRGYCGVERGGVVAREARRHQNQGGNRELDQGGPPSATPSAKLAGQSGPSSTRQQTAAIRRPGQRAGEGDRSTAATTHQRVAMGTWARAPPRKKYPSCYGTFGTGGTTALMRRAERLLGGTWTLRSCPRRNSQRTRSNTWGDGSIAICFGPPRCATANARGGSL